MLGIWIYLVWSCVWMPSFTTSTSSKCIEYFIPIDGNETEAVPYDADHKNLTDDPSYTLMRLCVHESAPMSVTVRIPQNTTAQVPKTHLTKSVSSHQSISIIISCIVAILILVFIIYFIVRCFKQSRICRKRTSSSWRKDGKNLDVVERQPTQSLCKHSRN